ncbi:MULTISPECIES: restriction endonuclease subunit S [unclassified Campylobacter]|uniref:restriction endonuclease subunit S n=1 Tax=unclassified Campylobacter TaxID=2593542 RepID=UPI001D46EF90|nr:restriction endonuclease subunit S [Campylobacter sp. RM9331]MBZ8005623.1 restriction endonuclease subunit S [Campylobacter sp. RM9332]
MTKLPNGWEWKKITEISEYRRGSFPQPYGNKEWYGGDGSMPFVQVADVGDNFLLKDLTKQNISTLAQPKSVFVEKGSVIVTLQGTIGKVAITQYDCFMDRTLAVFTKFLSDIDKKYFAYQLKSRFDIEKKEARGATIKTITKEEFSNFTIPLPPLEEQRKIVKILDEKFASIDESIRLVKADLLSLDELWQSILNDSFNPLKSKLDNDTYTLPPTWKWEKLGDICNITDGTHKTPTYQDDGIPFLSVKNISKGFFDLSDVRYISNEEHLKLTKRAKPEINDILICRIGTLGKAIKVDLDFEFSIFVSLGLLKPKGGFCVDYLVHFLNSPFMDIWIENNKIGGGTHTAKLNLNVLHSCNIALPPLKEQESKAKTIKELKELYTKRLKDYKELKESLLDLAFKGGL